MDPGRNRWSSLAPLSACLACAATSALASDDQRRIGDLLRFAMPAAVATQELWRDDHEGLGQFGRSWILTLGATEVLKRWTRIERPDRSDDMSFPSGHASQAFAAATYMHRRYGFGEAWPWYGAATYVGWTRVRAGRHRWVDVAGSAALAGASSRWLVSPAGAEGVSVVPVLAPGLIALEVRATW